MFFKIMFMYGFWFTWVIFLAAYVLFMYGLMEKRSLKGAGAAFDSSFKRLYSVSIIQLMIAVVLVFSPIILGFIHVHWYWICTGMITTLFIGGTMYLFMRYAENLSDKDSAEFKTKKQISSDRAIEKLYKHKKVFWVYVAVVLFVYICIPLDAFNVIKITNSIMPNMAPLYVFMLSDVIKVLCMVIANGLLIISVRKYLTMYFIATGSTQK